MPLTDADIIERLTESIKGLSKQVQTLQEVSSEESERLNSYKEEGSLLEFTMVTGGLIKGKILWVGNQSLGVKTSSGSDIILYKHAIAFIQELAN